MTDKPARRRRDPAARVESLAAATERVIATKGIEGLTHRAVAAEAGMPLGATTYHFATKDDLIAAALERAVDRFAAYLESWHAAHPALAPAELVEALADSLLHSFDDDHDQYVLESELYLAALRRPALRPLADRYTALTYDTLRHYVDADTAAAASAAMSGLSLQGVARSTPLTRPELVAILRRVITPNPALPDSA
ncbi:TetR/AcrR family transcriptional regulator [Nocardia huaxiensis]|uniref:TetR/AcrR family transcriptional regulator n=1 Tax=Nocardia huaxiensis TaxID=2755382 RepID=UPI001E5CD912|nr:TetR family transcriptional regulator [Nocardia huaxiensis]UFS97098.1 TetR family transcriptional regulator [Nocardia huaxiensis]